MKKIGRNNPLSAGGWALIGVCLALIGLDTIRSWQDRQTALADAGVHASELARSLAEQAQGVMLFADSVLLGLRERIETDGAGPAELARVQRVAAERSATLPVVESYEVFDATGRPLVDARGGQATYSVADRPYFKFHRDHPDRGLTVGAPVLSRASNRWVLMLSRRIDRADGGFGGVAGAALDIERLEALYGSLDLGAHSVVAWTDSAGRLLLRFPQVSPTSASVGPFPGAVAAMRRAGGTIEAKSIFDGIDRMVGFRHLDRYPIVMWVGVSRAEALAPWRRAAVAHLLAVLEFAGLVSALGVLLLRSGRRRQEAERQAASAAAEYRLLADYASDLILRVRAGGERVFVSPACLRLLGYTPAELLRRRSGDDAHPEDLQRLGAKWTTPPGADGTAVCRYRMRRRDGNYIWVEATSRSLPRGPDQPPENLVVVRDITERHRAAERLQEANRLLLRAEAITHLGHWRYDLDSRQLFWSEEMYRIVGWPGDRAPTAETATEVYHPDDRAEAAARLRATIETSEPSASQLRVLRPDASIRHVLTHGEAEYADDGRLVALVGTMQDVTERHELETRLRHSRKLEAIGHLASGVAHDFNNILQGILGGLELIQEDQRFEPELRCFADVALKSAQRGASLTHQLLSFARKQMLLPRPVALAPILDDLRTILSRSIGPHIVIEQTVAPSLPEIFVDPEHLQTALVNVAINAVQAMAEGGRLSIDATPEPGRAHSDARVVIAISDTGCGMDSATLAQATEPFFTTKGPAGTGLGLPMVQGFARQSGGDLRLSSLPGLGTRVEIALPQHMPMQQAVDAASAGPARPGGRHILLIDDVPEALFATASFLKKSGLEVATAESGATALALLAAGARFAALVTDYAMPQMNGLDLVTLARKIQPDLPALVITGFAEIDFSRATHVAAVLRKPFRRKELLDAIEALLETPLDPHTIPTEDFAGAAPRP